MRILLRGLVALTLTTPALASDGVLEINQTCAEQAGPTAGDEPGCFAGDTDGFPVTIDGSAGSSYVLTGNLTVPDENTTAISIDSDFVTLDLGGHSLIGPVICTSTTPISCSPAGTGRGVSTGAVTGVRVRNGTVRGMGDLGLGTNFAGSVEDLNSVGNASFGIFIGPGSSVERSRVAGNGDDGIRGTTLARVVDSTALNNAGDGIDVGDNSIVSGNTVSQLEANGIRTGSHGRVSQNTVSVSAAGSVGIRAANSTIVENVVHAEGQTGIESFGNLNSLIRGNVVRGANSKTSTVPST